MMDGAAHAHRKRVKLRAARRVTTFTGASRSTAVFDASGPTSGMSLLRARSIEQEECQRFDTAATRQEPEPRALAAARLRGGTLVAERNGVRPSEGPAVLDRQHRHELLR